MTVDNGESVTGGLYVSKPQHVEAIQWTGDNALDCIDFVKGTVPPEGFIPGIDIEYPQADLSIVAGARGAQGWVPVPVGYWIVRRPGDLTDHWPVDPDYFAAKYEPAENDGSGQ